MFAFLIFALAAAAIHATRLEERTNERIGEIFLLYVLVGYCGLPMLAVSIGILAFPDRMGEMLPIGEPTNVLAFFGWAYLGMSLVSLMALRYRGPYLIAPAVVWGVYFAGATAVHLHGPETASHLTHGGVLATFATHGLVTVVLGIALAISGLLKQRS